MRVSLICPYRLAVPGGVQSQVLGLAASLTVLGAEVLVVAPGEGSDHVAIAPGIGLNLVGRALAVPANGSRAVISPSPQAMWRTRRALVRFRPDVVHVHEPFVPGPALAAVLSPTAPLIATFHRSDASRGYRILGPLFRPLTHRMNELVAVSDAARETLRAVVGEVADRCSILANGVDPDRFARAVAVTTTTPTVAFVGRHEERKGLGVLIDAFARLGPNVELWIIGDGPLTPRLKARSAGDGRVRWLGRLDDDELGGRLKGADLVVAPAIAGESFGIVLLEAMAAGTAVLASDIYGYRLAAGEDAEYAAPGDVVGLAARIEALLADSGRRAELVAAGHRRAERHSIGALAEAYLEHYQAMLKRS